MKKMLREFWDQLDGTMRGREWFLALGTLCIVVVWLYFGSPMFFLKTFGSLPSLASDPLLDWWQYLYYHVNTLVLLGLIPLAIMRWGFGMRPAELGVRLGDWKWGLKFVVVAAIVTAPALYVSSFDPEFQREYPLTKIAGHSLTTWVLWELTYLIYYIGWEIYFRGVLLFGLREKFGVGGAIAFETAISTLVHLGAGHAKPFGETFSAAPAGFLFGMLALRTGSMLWPMLLHFYIGILNDVLSYMNGIGQGLGG